MMDRNAADHLVLPDIAFTSDEIAFAMKQMCMRYNAVRPYCHNITPAAIPDDHTLFLDGVVAVLYEMKRNNASLNDMDYSSGGVTANVNGNLLKNVGELSQFYYSRFMQGASEYKGVMNLNQAFGVIG